MVYAFPTNTALWDQYATLRADSLRADGDGREATAFYREHQAAMDEGAVVGWPARFNPDELSALQHAMNLKIRDEGSFMAEYQNEPTVQRVAAVMLTAEQIMAKINGLDRAAAPLDASKVTA